MWVIISRVRLKVCPNQGKGLRDAVRRSSKLMARSLMYQLFDHAVKRLIWRLGVYLLRCLRVTYIDHLTNAHASTID